MTANCSICGRRLRPDAPEQLCAACLMTAATETTSFAENEFNVGSANSDASSIQTSVNVHSEFGGYRLVKILGKGGMGVVYEAEQISTGRRVALKMLGKQLDSPEVRGRFLREGRLAAGVNHPNSIYVFGTEEIDGLPVITMEIASGGTLQDILDRQERLPVTDAVDAMLDVISGLEAALNKGVLHRDIKPSNCFVDPDGRVKVGDFGLSVSTIGGVDTFATATGVALGTPAFASPEQLRSGEVDQRSDIYSIGATLFTLLTGQQPFKANNAVQIVAAVLDETPRRVDLIRDEVPSELADIVARCLAKKPHERFSNYADLRKMLLPLSSQRPELEPAHVIRRTFSSLIDIAIAWTIPRTAIAASAGVLEFSELYGSPNFWFLFAASVVFYVGYFSLLESHGGASIGKRLLNLKVVTTSDATATWTQIFFRSFLSLLSLQTFLVLILVLAYLTPQLSLTTNGVLYIAIALGLLLFPAVTMRRNNGFAMVWDLLTGTRVVMQAAGAMPVTFVDASGIDQTSFDGQKIGAFHLGQVIVDGKWIEAIDPALKRTVWLLRRGDPNLPTGRKDAARSTRLRWLQSVHFEDEVWDAFAVKSGIPIVQALTDGRAHWQSTRHWLFDLTMELASASQDATLPNTLTVDHVWISQEGRAILLDEPWPTESVSDAIDVQDLKGQQNFLNAVADFTQPFTVPGQARGLLKNLRAGKFDRLSFLAGNFRSLLTKPACIDRGSRATALLTIPLLLIASSIFSFQTNQRTYRSAASKWSQAHPDVPPLSEVLRNRSQVAQDIGDDTLRRHLAGHYQHLLEGLEYRGDRKPIVATVGDYLAVVYLASVLKTNVEEGDLATADQKVKRAIDNIEADNQVKHLSGIMPWIPIALGVLIFIAALQLPAMILTGKTLGQIIFGYEVVDQNGQPATRWRMLMRWTIVWLPIGIIFYLGTLSPHFYWFLLLWLAGLAVAIANPRRAWQERWTGTWLVPS